MVSADGRPASNPLDDPERDPIFPPAIGKLAMPGTELDEDSQPDYANLPRGLDLDVPVALSERSPAKKRPRLESFGAGLRIGHVVERAWKRDANNGNVGADSKLAGLTGLDWLQTTLVLAFGPLTNTAAWIRIYAHKRRG
ncbi:glutaminyl-trna synthetase [Moesziomyces antarcticus T-34]|uniref:Glutaminyl-trna synthetase n=1 Tax=Pseudozyma antarctica (strain T-34) TaxID=1151754 RepID=M9LMB6_PSEA3|nr:glutaminyl-trna synthetase [Moesziomyces antarcticus T-34]